MLNEGWKPVGGVAFNNGFAYQSMAGVNDEAKSLLKERLEIENNKIEKNIERKLSK